jgi:hypothetical protein
LVTRPRYQRWDNFKNRDLSRLKHQCKNDLR